MSLFYYTISAACGVQVILYSGSVREWKELGWWRDDGRTQLLRLHQPEYNRLLPSTCNLITLLKIKWNITVTFESRRCKAIILSRKRNPSRPHDLFFGSTKIMLIEQMEVIGLCIDRNLQWTSLTLTLTSSNILDKISEHCGSWPTSLILEAESLQNPGQEHYGVLLPCLDECLTNNSWELDIIHKRALKITGVKGYAINKLLQQLFFSRCTLPTVQQTWSALSLPRANTKCLDRSFPHSAVVILV